MKPTPFIVISIGLLLFTSACMMRQEKTPEGPLPVNSVPAQEETGPSCNTEMPDPPLAVDSTDQIAVFPAGVLALLTYEDEMDLPRVLGLPLQEEVAVLENADTFSGSYRKTLTYEYTTLALFSPRDDGDHFYLYNLESSQEGLSTYRGLSVGDSHDDLIRLYPEAVRSLDGTTGVDGRYEYLLPETGYTYLYFFVENAKIIRIQWFHEFP